MLRTMKVAHNNKYANFSTNELLRQGKSLENTDPDEAISVYRYLIKKLPTKEAPHHRLILVYRKLKDYKNELAAVDEAIRSQDTPENPIDSDPHRKKIAQLSKALMKSTGLADKKGKPLFETPYYSKWKKRKQTLQKLIKK